MILLLIIVLEFTLPSICGRGTPRVPGMRGRWGRWLLMGTTKLRREQQCWVTSCMCSGIGTEPCVRPGTSLAFTAH